MHIAPTGKADGPPSNSVPGGRQHISLMRDRKLRRARFFSVKWEGCGHRETLPHEELEGKGTNPNTDVKQKIKYWETRNCGTSKKQNKTKKLLNNCLLWEPQVLLTQKYLCTTKAYWLNIWGISGLEHFLYLLEL